MLHDEGAGFIDQIWFRLSLMFHGPDSGICFNLKCSSVVRSLVLSHPQLAHVPEQGRVHGRRKVSGGVSFQETPPIIQTAISAASKDQ